MSGSSGSSVRICFIKTGRRWTAAWYEYTTILPDRGQAYTEPAQIRRTSRDFGRDGMAVAEAWLAENGEHRRPAIPDRQGTGRVPQASRSRRICQRAEDAQAVQLCSQIIPSGVRQAAPLFLSF